MKTPAEEQYWRRFQEQSDKAGRAVDDFVNTLVGKTVAKIEAEMGSVKILFTDGTKLELDANVDSDGCDLEIIFDIDGTLRTDVYEKARNEPQ